MDPRDRLTTLRSFFRDRRNYQEQQRLKAPNGYPVEGNSTSRYGRLSLLVVVASLTLAVVAEVPGFGRCSTVSTRSPSCSAVN